MTAPHRNIDRLLRSIAALAAVALSYVNQPVALGDGAMPTKVIATDVQRFTVYHSPQTPGYTCWAGAWVMPDGTLMVSFHQATGPFSNRPHAPKEILRKLTWPPGDGTNFGYDMTGLIQQVIYLASTDDGHTWKQVATYPYHSPMNGISKGPVALPDGTIIREVFGHYLPFWDVPQTGYVQHSTDRARSWGPPEPFMDPAEFMTWPGRLRLLHDGRPVLLGAYAKRIPGVETRAQWQSHMTLALWISSDGGHTWSEPIEVLPPGIGHDNECDCAELPDGRLLVVSRVDKPIPPHSAPRWQSILEPEGDTFRLVSAEPAPFPHSGYPDVLATREGVALHLASTGIHWTADAGQTWHDLGIGGTGYYPHSVQLPDGTIFCVYHRGGDNPYDGSIDQEIQALTFRLQVE